MRRTVSDDIIKSIGVINPMFHSFKTQEERRACGGSAFIEIQFCDIPLKTPAKNLGRADIFSTGGMILYMSMLTILTLSIRNTAAFLTATLTTT